MLSLSARLGDEAADYRLNDSAGCRVYQRDRIQGLQDREIRGDQHTSHPEVKGEIRGIGQSIQQKQSNCLQPKLRSNRLPHRFFQR